MVAFTYLFGVCIHVYFVGYLSLFTPFVFALTFIRLCVRALVNGAIFTVPDNHYYLKTQSTSSISSLGNRFLGERN